MQAHVSDFVRHVVSLTEQPPGFEQLATSFDSNSAVGIEAGGESPLNIELIVVEEQDLARATAELGHDVVEDLAIRFDQADLVGEEALFE